MVSIAVGRKIYLTQKKSDKNNTIRTGFMFKTTWNGYNIMLKKLLLSFCTLLFLLEVSSTSNVRNTEVVRISEVFNLPFVKIFRRKRVSRPIPYYHNSTSARRMILSGDLDLTLEPKILRNIPKVNLKERKAKMQRATLAIKLYELTQKDCHVNIVKMKHMFYAAAHYSLLYSLLIHYYMSIFMLKISKSTPNILLSYIWTHIKHLSRSQTSSRPR